MDNAAIASATVSSSGLNTQRLMDGTTAVVPKPPVPVPAVLTPTKAPWGDWFAQLVESEKHVLEVGGQAAWDKIRAQLPFYVQLFAPSSIKSYVDMFLTTIEGSFSGKTLDVSSSNKYITAVVNLLVVNEPQIVAWAEENLLIPLIVDAFKLAGIVLTL